MLARSCLAFAALFLAAASAAEAPVPLQTFRFGAAAVELRRDGSFAVTEGGAARVANARLMLFGPNWEGASQQDAQVTQATASADGAEIRARLVERASGKVWEVVQRVRREGRGLRLEYECRPLETMSINELSLVLDLPIETYKGKRLLLFPRAEVPFPPEKPAQKHFVTAAATRYVFAAGEPWAVSLGLDLPRVCNVQDTRDWNGTAYQAFVKLHSGLREVGPNDRFTFACTLVPNDREIPESPRVALESAKPLRVGRVRVEPAAPRVGERVTLHLDVEGTWKTPFWQEEIAVDALFRGPDGRTVSVPAFYTRGFKRSLAPGSAGPQAPIELLTPEGAPEWQVRFLPDAPGDYQVTIRAVDRTGRVEARQSFRAAPGQRRPYVRVSRTDPHYFEFDDGAPYFANGMNVCWFRSTSGTYDYDRWFGGLSRAGGNYARLWMRDGGFGFEWGKPGEYQLDRAWQMDYVVGLAEEKGIYLKVCLENFRYFTANNPYDKANGGPCEHVLDVFTHPEAKRMWRNRLRYAVARWGYSPNLLAWEFWNEIDCIGEGEKDPAFRYKAPIVQAWAKEMAAYLKRTDPFHHLVVNSLGSFTFEPDLWAIPEIDFAQMHGYWNPGWKSKEFGKDMAQMMADNVALLRPFGKPAFFAEFGLVKEDWGHSPRMAEDREGVHLHNGMWGAMMAGAAGTGHLWWWDNYVDPQNLWYHYGGVAGFIRGVPWNTEGFQPFVAQSGPAGLRVLGLRGKTMTLLWAQNRANTWWNVVEKQPIPPVEGARVLLPEARGACTVEVWDPYTGKRLSSRQETAGAQGLALDLGAVAKDVAVKVVGR